jgi:hypothetical protein
MTDQQLYFAIGAPVFTVMHMTRLKHKTGLD